MTPVKEQVLNGLSTEIFASDIFCFGYANQGKGTLVEDQALCLLVSMGARNE
jgi:hypothetical protein